MNEITQAVRMMEGGQLRDLCSTMALGVPLDLTFESADEVLAHKGELLAHVRNFYLFRSGSSDPLKDWERFYQKAFGRTVDLSGVKIPIKKAGFNRLIVIVPGITLNQVYEVSAKHYRCSRYTEDLDMAIPKHDRDPSKIGAYAIWIRGGDEPDADLMHLSADDLAKKGTQTTTMLEQKIFELKYFLETKKHLDQRNVTLCAGSRLADGSVSSSDWSGDESLWHWYGTDSQSGSLGGREVVS
jgi:hypothetical protein